MIKRINMVEKKVFSLTYLRILQIFLIMVTINACMIGYKTFLTVKAEKEIKKVELSLKDLERRRDELMKKPVKQKISVGQYQDLIDRLSGAPPWSKLLQAMTDRLPNSVWITNFKVNTDFIAATTAPSNDKNAPPTPQPASTKNSMDIEGVSTEMAHITDFANRLAGSGYFINLVLSDSSRNGNNYSFKIKSETKNAE